MQRFSLCVFLVLISLLLRPFPGQAELTDDVAKDLLPVPGSLVMTVGTEWLVDLDATQGTRVGDLFSVVGPGERVVHPTTGKVLGTLDAVKGFVQVTRVKEGYSYASILSASEALSPGDRIRRWENLPALFWDDTGGGEPLFQALRERLPHLDWTPYADAQAARPRPAGPLEGQRAVLVFLLDEYGLGVKDGAFQTLRSYPPEALGGFAGTAFPALPLSPAQPPAPPAVPAPAVSATAATSGQLAGSTLSASLAPAEGRGAIIRKEAAGLEGVWSSAELKGQPVGIEVGDLDGDGRLEVAVCFKDRLEIGRVAAKGFDPLSTLPLKDSRKLISLDGADLDGDGRLELYLTAGRGEELASFVVELVEGGLQEVISRVPWWFRRVDLPEEGPVLLAQRMGAGEDDFSGSLFRVVREDRQLKRGPAVKLPGNLALYCFVPFEGAKGDSLLANLSGGDRLQVLDAGGAKLWESEDQFGGSESFMVRTEEAYEPGPRFVFLKARLERNGGEVLVPVNEGSRLGSAYREFRQSHLKAMRWDGFAMVETWRTGSVGGYLADFRVADADNDGADELVTVVAFSHGDLFKKATPRSSVLIYEIQ
ncbi:MAG: hypothetical protein C0617_11635 [Desulfuromonas sp.]|uniref:FG-GAP repeat domain-containing protein n=1 Tax=Desulfuromonas sp. TaxID=892 RepID=UPI000CBE3B72|nr:VCBS repeat-containing protein [Desulfuromonas sp.]PLX83184.1 MAG: hypothetical protein C0617_11635 [Desulfuromonas sp.]